MSSDRGPRLTLTQSVGASARSGADALLGYSTLDGLVAKDSGNGLRQQRMRARFAYGFHVRCTAPTHRQHPVGEAASPADAAFRKPANGHSANRCPPERVWQPRSLASPIEQATEGPHDHATQQMSTHRRNGWPVRYPPGASRTEASTVAIPQPSARHPQGWPSNGQAWRENGATCEVLKPVSQHKPVISEQPVGEEHSESEAHHTYPDPCQALAREPWRSSGGFQSSVR